MEHSSIQTGMDSEKQYAPFAITAKATGRPRKLYTPILLVNFGIEPFRAAYVNAMWDTGAEVCIMTRELASRLGFSYEKEIESKGLTGSAQAHYGYASVSLISNGEVIDTMAAIVQGFEQIEYSFILGLDFIRKGTLAISSKGLETVLSFTIPTRQHIDFVQSIEDTDVSKKYIPLSSGYEDKRVYHGADALEQLIKDGSHSYFSNSKQ